MPTTENPRQVKTISAKALRDHPASTLIDVAERKTAYLITLRGRLTAVIMPLPDNIEGELIGRMIESGELTLPDLEDGVANGRNVRDVIDEMAAEERAQADEA